MSDMMTEAPAEREALDDQLIPDTRDNARPTARPGGKSPELTAQLVRNRYDKGVKAQRAEIRNYWLNCAFLEDEQWVWWNTELNRLDQFPRDQDRVQLTVNRLRPTSRSIIAKLVSRDIRFEVPPTAPDDATQRAARIGESALEDKRVEESWEQLREEAVWATWKGGSGILAIEWDSSRGQEIEYAENGRMVGTGDIYVCALSVAEFVVEPGTRNAETGNWWIKASAMPPEQVQAEYQLPKVPPADAVPGATPLQEKMLNERRGEMHTPLTLVLQYFERPNWLRPQGAVATVVDMKIVDGPHPWPFPFKNKLNFAMMRETMLNGKALGTTVLNAARPVQTALNAAFSNQAEHMKLAGNARLVVPQSSLDLIDEFTDQPAEILPVPDGAIAKPEWISPPQMPSWWLDAPQRLIEQIDDILGHHKVSRGDAPQNIESGFGLTILAEQDATPLARMSKEQAIAFGKIGTMCLELWKDKARETRTSKVQTPGYPAQAVKWTGKDLKDQTTAIVPLDAIVPRSRAAMQAFAEKMIQMKLDPATAAQFAKLADLPDQRDVVDALAPDIAKARRENHKMSLGGDENIEVPADYDDHNLHIQEHNTYRKSLDYELLDQNTKNMIDTHIQGHATMSNEELGQQFYKAQHNPLMAAAANPQGAPAMTVPEAMKAMQQGQGAPGQMEGVPGGGPLPGAPPAETPPVTSGFPEGVPAPPPPGAPQ